MNQNRIPLIEVRGVKKSFKQNDRKDLLVLDDVQLSLQDGEVVALLGRTGSGKSTLMRIIAGLTRPSSGDVLFHGEIIKGPVKGLSMVFQNFALLPWLNVLQNVELGLEAQGLPADTRRERSLKAIDIVGMDGFESAYPKEISGGMCQRVGLARALVVNPDVLLMDEPFSALDVLTSENLRNDIIHLWRSGKTNIRSMLMVTHNIEEAVLMADRILVFNTDPGYIREIVKVNIPHPRAEHELRVRELVDTIYGHISEIGNKTDRIRRNFDLRYRLPAAEISEMTGLLESLNSLDGHQKASLQGIADEMNFDVDDLFPITEALEIMQFARVKDGDIELTKTGKLFAQANILNQKKIFATQLLATVPLARHVRRILDERPGHQAQEGRFISELEDGLSEDAAAEVLRIVIDWARFAEIFAYDFNTGTLSLENPS